MPHSSRTSFQRITDVGQGRTMAEPAQDPRALEDVVGGMNVGDVLDVVESDAPVEL